MHFRRVEGRIGGWAESGGRVRCAHGRVTACPILPFRPASPSVIRDSLRSALRHALDAAGLPEPADGIAVDAPREQGHGDWSSNVAMQLAKPMGRPPREIAEALVGELTASPPPYVEHIEVAGPGFVNFHLGPGWLHDVLREVVRAGDGFGRSDALAGQRVNLEFVSANPTGPLHAGGGRWVAVGDAIANLLEAQGAVVHREYYLNDAGNQLDTFADSLLARLEGREPPQDGYHGQYLVELAERLRSEVGASVTRDQAREWGYRQIVRELQEQLEMLGVHFDTWFSEKTLYERGDVDSVLSDLTAAGFTYEADGATWLQSSRFGDQRDR